MRYLAPLLLLAAPVFADDPRIESVAARETDGGWSFEVTLTHPDTGWDHYADGWRVLAPDGTELGLRVLAHPHVNEQPFTRGLSGVQIPAGITQVQVQARCLTDGWAETTTLVDLN